MDRLLCGDVGYGKTEVAMRAAFKAVMDGKQVAVLAPTTVLAFQHVETLQAALRGVPRAHRRGQPLPHRRRTPRRSSRSSPRAGSTSSSARTGCCRRTCSSRDLGLLIVDEEQRFGVAHKERIKQMRKKVDVLTHDGDADSAHAEHVARRHPRHVGDRDAAEGSPGDSDQRRQVRRAGDRPRDPERDGARRPGVLRPQPHRVDLLDGQPDSAARARSARRRRPRPDGRAQAREGDARLHGAQVRRAAVDDDRRERHRHPERQHHHHQPRRSLRAVAALSAARPRRPQRSAGVSPIC